MTEQEWIEKLKSEGIRDIKVWSEGPGAQFGEHTHLEQTVHVILEGEFILLEKDGDKTYKTGERFEVPAGTTHNAKCGAQGCKFIVGVKK
ncbi:MAG: cupin domain-containing protein [Candidatus Taylorbacteria bacterium]|nr:cupin domain-containing protein [Candidatus Taylorbacteria bacterium]